MTFSLVFWSIAAVVVLIVLPIAMIRGMVQHFHTRPSERRGSGGISAGIGAALHELDRMIARPSVEHQVDTEQRVLKRENDQGGD
jgi:hypothetical protein